MDHRRLIKKLILAEYDWLGKCDLGMHLDDPTLSVAKFTADEISEMSELRSEAFADWMLHSNDTKENVAKWNPETCQFNE